MTAGVATEMLRLVGRRLGVPPGEVKGSVLADTHGVRTVLQVDWPGNDGVVAKRYSDGTGKVTSVHQRALVHQLPTGEGRLGIPAPLFYDEDSRTFVQELVRGENLATLVANGSAGAMEPAGRAVAELHQLESPAAETLSILGHASILMRPQPRRLAGYLPWLAERIDTLQTRLAAAAPRPGAFRNPIHRDVHPRQMLVEGERVWLVDWDLFGCGDPALDVGNMSVWLETHLAPALARECRERFLTGYLAVATTDVLPRIDLYRAFTYLRLACKRFRLGGRIDDEIVPMIAAAEDALA